METLIPDVKVIRLETILAERPHVVSHNMETVKRLYRTVRPQAKYERSLDQIQRIKAYGLRTKTGFMVGLVKPRRGLRNYGRFGGAWMRC